MKELIYSFQAFLFCLIALLFAELFCHIPAGMSWGISCFYFTEILVTGLITDPKSENTVEWTDLLLSVILFLIQYVSVLRFMTLDQQMTVLYAITVSTISFGCNRRFNNHTNSEKSPLQAGKD